MKIDLVITKNVTFFEYLVGAGIVWPDTELKEHVTAADVICKHVLGDDLPHCLSCVALSYTEVPLHLPRELIGLRLLLTDYMQYAVEPITYLVKCVSKNEEKRHRYFC